jgi:acyl-ACP thioesterase
MIKPAIYEFKIKTIDVDPRQRLTLPGMADLIQEAAWRHAKELGVSSYELMKNNLTWVLSRLRVEVKRPPGHEDTVLVKTWPSGSDGLKAYRTVEIMDQQKNICAVAHTVWLVIDVEKRQVAAMPEVIGALVTENDIDQYVFTKKIDNCRATAPQFTTKAGFYELDINNHVNNTHYLRWALESFSAQHLLQQQLQAMEVVFRSEAGYGETIHSMHHQQADGTFVHVVTGNDDRELIRALTWWS